MNWLWHPLSLCLVIMPVSLLWAVELSWYRDHGAEHRRPRQLRRGAPEF